MARSAGLTTTRSTDQPQPWSALHRSRLRLRIAWPERRQVCAGPPRATFPAAAGPLPLIRVTDPRLPYEFLFTRPTLWYHTGITAGQR